MFLTKQTNETKKKLHDVRNQRYFHFDRNEKSLNHEFNCFFSFNLLQGAKLSCNESIITDAISTKKKKSHII